MTNREAIEALERLKHCMEYTPPKELEAIGMAITALESPRPDWTPCAEGLPTRCTEYRTTVLDTRCGARFGMNMRFNAHTQQWTDAQQKELATCYAVIAWQPLPGPYNPGRKEDAK